MSYKLILNRNYIYVGNMISMKQRKIMYDLFFIIFLILMVIPTIQLKSSEIMDEGISPNIGIESFDDGRRLSVTLKNHDDQVYESLEILIEISEGFILTQRDHSIISTIGGNGTENDMVTIIIEMFGIGLGRLTPFPKATIQYRWDGLTHVIGTLEFSLLGSFIDVDNVIFHFDQVFDGYTLFTPEYGTDTYLIDTYGTLVHQWNGSYIQGMGTYLMDNGNLIRTDMKYPNLMFRIGGRTGHIGIYKPDGSVVWDFDYSTDMYCLHHDIEVLPNGNILAIAWEYKSEIEALEQGRNWTYQKDKPLFPDSIIEIKPTSPTTGDIVWEWHVWDHLIQDYDPFKPNYGIVANYPERINLNYETLTGGISDWSHINSIDYHEEFDQILLSVKHFNEIWVIDHSTTSEEAAGSTGGRYGKGGDLLYRWGNPAAYNQGNESDQQLFYQHDARWVKKGYPGEGNIIVFNNYNFNENNPNVKFSTVDEITPPITSTGSYLKLGSMFGPTNVYWQYQSEPPEMFFSTILSGAQRLPNGNTLICNGKDGYFFEVNAQGGIVWEYDKIYGSRDDDVFTVTRYSLDHPGIIALLS
jgi:hypothetical protein